MFEVGDKVYFNVGKSYGKPYSGYGYILQKRPSGGWYVNVSSFDDKWKDCELTSIIVAPNEGAVIYSKEIAESPLFKALQESDN